MKHLRNVALQTRDRQKLRTVAMAELCGPVSAEHNFVQNKIMRHGGAMLRMDARDDSDGKC